MSDAAALQILHPEVPAGNDWLSKAELASLTPEIIRQRLVALQPLIREHAAEAERNRQPVTKVIEAIRKTGYFYMMIPKAYGGLGASPDDLIDATTPIAEACVSTAWVAAFVANHNWLLAHFPKQAQDETWGGDYPYVFAPAVSAPPGLGRKVDGGYQVDGHWKWGTCVMHADWVIVFLFLATDGEPEYGMALLPVSDVKVIDTWNSDGMRGTGSHDIRVEDIFVPAHRTTRLGPIFAAETETRHRFDSAVYGMPMLPFLCFAASIPAIGGARAAIAAVAKRHSVHTRVGDAVVQMEKPISQMRLARADLLAKTGELLIRNAGREMLCFHDLPEADRMKARLLWRAQIAEGVHMCNEAVRVACASAGSSLHFLDNPLQRIMRDMNVQSTHFVFDQDAAQEQYGRYLVGLTPNAAFF